MHLNKSQLYVKFYSGKHLDRSGKQGFIKKLIFENGLKEENKSEKGERRKVIPNVKDNIRGKGGEAGPTWVNRGPDVLELGCMRENGNQWVQKQWEQTMEYVAFRQRRQYCG